MKMKRRYQTVVKIRGKFETVIVDSGKLPDGCCGVGARELPVMSMNPRRKPTIKVRATGVENLRKALKKVSDRAKAELKKFGAGRFAPDWYAKMHVDAPKKPTHASNSENQDTGRIPDIEF